MSTPILHRRSSGILLHITSLPSKYGIGDLGPEAYKFADKLKESGQFFWQVLPLNPTNTVSQSSPYSSPSAFAMNELIISPDMLVKHNFLEAKDVKDAPCFSESHVEFEKVTAYKKDLFTIAYKRFKQFDIDRKAFETFVQENSFWLEDYALYCVVKENFTGRSWTDWPQEIALRQEESMEDFKGLFGDRLNRVKFLQFIVFSQWRALKEYCNRNNVRIIGDIPIYVSYDSVDVWSQPQNYKLDERLNPFVVAGVPPDYFSQTGQRWGNPVYNWDFLKANKFDWWVKRVEENLKLFDLVRVDHFRGLVQYWEIPSDHPTAEKGCWQDVPTEEFFSELNKACGELPFIAEDLGIITQDVRDRMDDLGFPGMKILLFAFNGDMKAHPYLPHNFKNNCVVYTGTHDNNTIWGWLEDDATEQEIENLLEYLKKDSIDDLIHWDLISLAFESEANLAIIPLQDILGLPSSARMNTPGTMENNWRWRLVHWADFDKHLKKLSEITVESSRSPQKS